MVRIHQSDNNDHYDDDRPEDFYKYANLVFVFTFDVTKYLFSTKWQKCFHPPEIANLLENEISYPQ